MDRYRANGLAIVLDSIESTFILMWSLAAAPFLAIGRFKLSKTLCFLRVLAPLGLTSSYLRVRSDLKMGRLDRAVANLESIITTMDEALSSSVSAPRIIALVLADLYGQLARTQLRRGHIESAARTVIRAHRGLGVERLAGLADFDSGTAQLVRDSIQEFLALNSTQNISNFEFPPEVAADFSQYNNVIQFPPRPGPHPH